MARISQTQAMKILRLAQFAIVVALAAPVLAANDDPKPSVPLSNPGQWVSSEDYPTAALRNEIEGVTRFVLAIDPYGIVENCRISVSSGSSELDAATCNLITARARFKPARDNRGKPVASTWASSVRWQIPKDAVAELQPEAGLSMQSFLILADGTMSDCRF